MGKLASTVSKPYSYEKYAYNKFGFRIDFSKIVELSILFFLEWVNFMIERINFEYCVRDCSGILFYIS